MRVKSITLKLSNLPIYTLQYLCGVTAGPQSVYRPADPGRFDHKYFHLLILASVRSVYKPADPSRSMVSFWIGKTYCHTPADLGRLIIIDTFSMDCNKTVHTLVVPDRFI